MRGQARVIGSGAYLPERVMSNDDIAQLVDTSDEWIRPRSGITQRHLAAQNELTSDLAIAAARGALLDAGIAADAIDLIIVATTTPDRTFPATAVKVQHALGVCGGPAFDIQAACAGFLYGLSLADKFIASGEYRTVLLIGAETLSRIIDWQDRSTCVLFGDGAGALLIQAQDDASSDIPTASGIIATCLHADGASYDSLCADGGPSLNQAVGFIRMDGQDVYRQAVERLTTVSQEVLAVAGVTISAVDWFVPHQANIRIMESVARRLTLKPEKLVSTIGLHANTSAASIPLALNTWYQAGDIKTGDLILLAAIGGGLTWASSLLRW